MNDASKWIPDDHICRLRPGESGNSDIEYNGCPPELPWCLNIAPNPNAKVTNFDNILYALLNVFVTITLEGWADIQYKLTDAGATYCWIYFVSLTFIVGFFAANLCLAIIERVYSAQVGKMAMDQHDGHCEKMLRNKKVKRPCGKCFRCKMKEAKRQMEESWNHHRDHKMVVFTKTPAPPTPATRLRELQESGGTSGNEMDPNDEEEVTGDTSDGQVCLRLYDFVFK